jgi:hypothetical protein
MLRLAVLAVGVALLIAGVIADIGGVPAITLWLLGAGGVITAGTLFERVLYKPLQSQKPGAGWVKTGERFVDPDTGQTVDVFFEPASGERQYVSQHADRPGQT